MMKDPEFWTIVINGSANLVIAGAMFIQTVIFFITFIFGFKYLNQHDEKIKLERKRLAGENCLKALLYTDRSIAMLFNKNALMEEGKYSSIKQTTKASVAHVSTENRDEAFNYLLIARIFLTNYGRTSDILLRNATDLNANGLFLRDQKFANLYDEFIDSIKYLTSLFTTRSRLVSKAKLTNENFFELSESLPTSYSDEKNSAIQRYFLAKKNLQDFLVEKG